MRRARLLPVALAFLSGLLLFLAFPPFELHLLAWVALVPLLVALDGRSLPASFGLGGLTGLVAFRGIFYWINRDQGVTWPDAALLNLYLALYVGLFALAWSFAGRRSRLPALVVGPALWVALEYARGHVDFLSLPWGFLAHSQYRNVPLIQLAALTGVWGVSALTVMANVAVRDAALAMVRRRSPATDTPALRRALAMRLALVAGLAGLVTAVGAAVVPGRAGVVPAATASVAPGAPAVTIAGDGASPAQPRTVPDKVAVTVVQGNIPQRERWVPGLVRRNVEQHITLTRESTMDADARRTARPALIVWPETAVPLDAFRDPGLAGALMRVPRETGAPLLLGSALRPKFGPPESRREKLVNSAMLFSPGGRLVKQYDKVRLVPFGEYLPHTDVLPWPERIRASAGRFVPGLERTLFEVDGARFATVICWEVIFPEIVRQVVSAGAGFVVNLTNEAWFGDTAAPHQFQAIAVFRAVENRVAIVRAANTGISGFIDPYGRITGTVSQGGRETFVAGTLTRDVPITRGGTLYTRFGDIFAYAAVAVSAVAIGTAGWRRRAPR